MKVNVAHIVGYTVVIGLFALTYYGVMLFFTDSASAREIAFAIFIGALVAEVYYQCRRWLGADLPFFERPSAAADQADRD